MVFKRYHDPFLFLDTLIDTSSLDEGVTTIYKQINEEKLWDMYLHSMSELPYEDWKNKVTTKTDAKRMNKNEVETAVNNSKDILNNFTPKKKGGI